MATTRATKRYTFASMIKTDGKTTLYGVYQGVLRADNAINCNVRSTKRIATMERCQPERFCYRCAEEWYSTTDVPPVPWKSHAHTCGLEVN